jgi:hypothetical protein
MTLSNHKPAVKSQTCELVTTQVLQKIKIYDTLWNMNTDVSFALFIKMMTYIRVEKQSLCI